MAALIVLRNKAIKPLLAAAQELRPHAARRIPARLTPITIRFARVGRLNIDKYFFGLRP
jgi:hypothetical protein